MGEEIREGPQAIASGLAALGGEKLERPRGVVIFARGSSDNAAIYGRYVIEALAGVPVVLGAPSLATIYRAPTNLCNWLAVGVSQSGQTQEIVECLQWARRQGAATAAITNDPDSRLAGEVATTIELRCGAEHAVAATKTFLGECAALAALAYSWSERNPNDTALIEAAESTLATPTDDDLVDSFAKAGALLVLGRGYRYPIALEISLKLMEACRIWAVGMSWADLLHGPITALPPGASCLLLADRESLRGSYESIRDRLALAGAEIVTSQSMEHETIEEPLLPILDALALQRPILEAALRRGLDPDRPAGLTKVTQT